MKLQFITRTHWPFKTLQDVHLKHRIRHFKCIKLPAREKCIITQNI